jgi:cardiolipin synthase
MTLPNLLTLLRVVAIPPIVVSIMVPGSLAGIDLRVWASALFLAAAVTDWLDGYFARRFGLGSAWGRMMDPIADKVLVASVLVCLTATGELVGWAIIPTLVIITRELLVSGLREALAGQTVILPVTFLAKIKTTTQLVALVLLLAVPAEPALVWQAGLAALWLAAVLTVITGAQYYSAGLRQLGATMTGK